MYRQAIGRLRDGDAYCCMGVACDIDAPGKDGRWYHDHYYGNRECAPKMVTDRYGWDHRNGALSEVRDVSLTELNDKGASFDEIASVIEAGLVRSWPL